jgi:CheY-like chemotaxis protein
MHLDGKRVMIVEDDLEARESLVAVLTSEGYAVVAAEHGQEALEQLRKSPSDFCLIVLDLFMPVMNGWAFRDAQVKDPNLASIPVVVISADASAARRAAGLGIVAAMTKPVDFDRFLAVVGEYC